MALAERLHKSLAEIMALDSRELGLWQAKFRQEADEQHSRSLEARAAGALRKR